MRGMSSPSTVQFALFGKRRTVRPWHRTCYQDEPAMTPELLHMSLMLAIVPTTLALFLAHRRRVRKARKRRAYHAGIERLRYFQRQL